MEYLSDPFVNLFKIWGIIMCVKNITQEKAYGLDINGVVHMNG
jgi:hypothetical protein